MRRPTWILAPALLALATAAPGADLAVGAGATLDLGNGSLDLGCADLGVSGTLSAGSVGLSQARDLDINPGGLLEGESATLEVAGDWGNAGSFDAGTSTVQMVDGCGLLSAVISGDTTFANLEMTTTSGFLYSFVSGSTQTVTDSLNLLGASGNLLTIRSTVGGSEAFFDVQGMRMASYVDVEDNDATGGVPIPVDSNSVLGSNTPGWFVIAAIPALGVVGLAALALALLRAARPVLSKRRPG